MLVTAASAAPSRFLLFQYRAADSSPLLGFKEGIEKFDELLLAGAPTLTPRLAVLLNPSKIHSPRPRFG
jgi:hypothetical protein